MNISQFLEPFEKQYPDQGQYLETLKEVASSVVPYLESINADQAQHDRFRQMVTPEQIVQFRVDWVNDAGDSETNWGYRVQHNSARGPYKGGLRFDPSVTVDILKFLALEQTFKNALTGLPLGSGKGGSDFSPRGRSEDEIKRFAEAFMGGLYKHIGPETDVPAGDIGVGGREITYMLHEYQRLTNSDTKGVLTGKAIEDGGSYTRTEATGYGVVYLVHNILEARGDSMQDKNVVISGSGNVATYAALKAVELGGKVLTLSDRGGYIYKADGLSADDIQLVIEHKAARQTLQDLEVEGAVFKAEGNVWQEVSADVYLPCATQNEIDERDAQTIVGRGAIMVAEGANMPCTNAAVEVIQQSDTVFVPAKAANAGGVAVSGLEMEQNRLGEQWSFEEVDGKLQQIMSDIHQTITKYGEQKDGSVDYLRGANIGGYVLVDQAMQEQKK